MRKLYIAAALCVVGVSPLLAQSSAKHGSLKVVTPVAEADVPGIVDAALHGLSVRLRVLSGLETGKQVDVTLDTAFVKAAARGSAESTLQRAVSGKSRSGERLRYRVKFQSMEMRSGNIASVLATIQTRDSGGCDVRTFRVNVARMDSLWKSILAVEEPPLACLKGEVRIPSA